MLKRTLISIGLLGSLAGCASMQPQDNVQFQPANQIVEKPVIIKPPVTEMHYQLTNTPDPALKKAYEQYLKTGKAYNIVTDGFEQFAYGVGSQPVINATPFEQTVISLEPGENVTNVTSGDPTRWSYALAYSGHGNERQAHIMIKPSQYELSTNLIITTDKRLYTLAMVSTKDGKYIRDVRFWYPEEQQAFWDNYTKSQAEQLTNGSTVATLPDISVNDLNMDYAIKPIGWFVSSPSWMPLRAFDDKTHTYIEFPRSMANRDMPALFIVNQSGQQELVNYRSKPPYFIVDKLFKQAVLVMGVGSHQTKVSIINKKEV